MRRALDIRQKSEQSYTPFWQLAKGRHSSSLLIVCVGLALVGALILLADGWYQKNSCPVSLIDRHSIVRTSDGARTIYDF
jgi:hypothetical protein